jgi:hypothetical protein
MPIVVTCPGCPTKLSAPDHAAGKQIRCPKCGAAAPVPDFIPAEEVPVVEAAIVPPKPKPKPVQAEVDEDEPPRKKATRRDDDDEPPRKKKKRRYEDDDDDPPRRRRRSGGGGGGAMVAVIIVGGVLLLVGLGVGIYFLTSKGGPLAKKTPLPPGWQEYSYPQDKFKAPFPKEPQVVTMQAGAFPMGGMGGMGPMRGGRGGFAGGMEIPEIESVSTYISGLMQPDEQVTIQVTIARFKKDIPRAMRDQMNQVTSGQVGGLETRKVRWLGYDAGEIIVAGSLTRVVYTDRMMILVQISGRNGARAKPEEEAAFFDNFQLTK